jgi:Flp pilus assembly pilin Flp
VSVKLRSASAASGTCAKAPFFPGILGIACLEFFGLLSDSTPFDVQFCSGTGIAVVRRGQQRESLQEERSGQSMNILQRLLAEEDGQGLIEYTLILFFVALVFWVAIKDTTAGSLLSDNWGRITACVAAPFSCGS